MAVKATKKASVGTEIVLGQAAQQITKAVNELNLAAKTVNELTSKAEEMTLLVANKESQISDLEVQYAERARQAAVEFDLNLKANAERVVTETLRASGKEAIASSELKALRDELQTIKSNSDAEVKKQVAIVSATLKSQFDNDLRFMQSENKAIASENASKIVVLAEKNTFLENQNKQLFDQITQERNASIERAKASAIGNVNIGDSSRK